MFVASEITADQKLYVYLQWNVCDITVDQKLFI